MNSQRQYRFSSDSPLGGFVGILVAVLLFLGLISLMGFIFRILWFLLPVIIIATAIIDVKVIVGYFNWVVGLFRRNWVMGLAATLLTVVGAPVVGLILLTRALFRRRVKEAQAEYERRTQGELVDYEEIDSETLDLPDMEEPPRDKPENGNYNKFFES